MTASSRPLSRAIVRAVSAPTRKFADLEAYDPHADRPFLEPTDEKRGGRNRPAVLYRAATSDLVTFPQRF